MALKKIFAAVLAAALMLPLLALPAGALGPVSETLYAGIDVSEYQGEIDWEQVKAAGIEVAYIKSSQADFTDPEFTRNAAGAREAGVHFGFYHYLTAKTEEEAQVQARFFVQTIENTGYDCRPVMDFEDFSGLSDAEVNAIGLAFMEEVERLTGVTPVLYTDAYAANTLWDAAFGAYPLWAADYGPSEPEITAGHWAGWSGFQYADDGRVDGISDAVDLDRFTSGVFLDGAEPEPDPEPEPEPDPDPEPETGYTTYTVRAGDTLWAIARRYGTTVTAIADANAIANPNLIYVGETLKIPTGTGGASVSYTVRAGDTLWAIARRYGTTVAAIADANHIANPNLIYVGEVLTIPS